MEPRGCCDTPRPRGTKESIVAVQNHGGHFDSTDPNGTKGPLLSSRASWKQGALVKVCEGHNGVRDTTDTEICWIATFEHSFEGLRAGILYDTMVVTWAILHLLECTGHQAIGAFITHTDDVFIS